MSKPPRNVLKIDIDLPYELFQHLKEGWLRTRALILSRYGLKIEEYSFLRSPSGKVHAYLTLNRELSAKEIAILQFFCGDDHRRALFNFARLAFGEKIFHAFNILFAEKRNAEEVKDPVIELALKAFKEGGDDGDKRDEG